MTPNQDRTWLRAMALHSAMKRRARCRDVLYCRAFNVRVYPAFNRNINMRNHGL